MFLLMRTMEYWQPSRKKLKTGPKNFRSKAENSEKIKLLQFSSWTFILLSSGHAEWCFDYPTGKKLPESDNVFAHCLKIIKIFQYNLNNFFSLNWSSGHVNCSFDKTAEKRFPESQEKTDQCPKVMKKLYNLSQEIFPSKCSSGYHECNFDNPAE